MVGKPVNNMIKLVDILNEVEINKCPAPTQNIELNLKNRQKAINEYGYGPLNPNEPNEKFWKVKVDMWKLDSAEEAKKSLCSNCAAFDITPKTLDCIASGIDAGDKTTDSYDVIDAGKLGYCRFLKFKCAGARTCDAWVVGGPITESVDSMKKELMQQLKWVNNQIKKAKNDSDVRKYTRIKNDTLSKLDHIKKTGKYENVNEDGFPGGVGVGLSLPGGYINGAPSYDKVKSTKKRIQNDKNNRYTKVEQK